MKGWFAQSVALAIGGVLVSGCASMGNTGNGADVGRYFHSDNPQQAIIRESDEFNFDYEISDLEGRTVRGQVFDDGERTYFVAPQDADYKDIQDSAGRKRESELEGMYRVTSGVESMWFARLPDDRVVCIRAGWMSQGACQDAVEATRGRSLSRDELEHKREALIRRLEAIENNQRQE